MDKIRKIYDKRVFVTAFLATIIIHGEMIFNKISFHDDLDTLFDGWRNSIRHGRWMYRFLSLIPEKLAGMESVPVLIGIIVASCIGLMACLFFELFYIKNFTLQFVLIVVMSAIPAVAGDFGYMGYAGYDYIGKLLCVIAAYLICKGLNGKINLLTSILGASVLACSIGEYQCHLTFFLSILLIYFIWNILEREVIWKEFWSKAVYYVGMAVVGLVLYLLVLEIVLKMTGLELTSYAGMDSYGIVGFSEYIHRVAVSYTDFLSLDSVAAYSMFPFRWNGWKLLVLAAFFALTAAAIIVTCLNKNYKKSVQILITACLIPLGMNFNFVLYGQGSTHSLHMYQYVLLFMYLVIMMQYIIQHVPAAISRRVIVKHGIKMIRSLTIAVIFVFGVLYVRYDNMCYMQLEMRQEAAIRYFGTLITRIESTEGYNTEYPVVYINSDQKENISDHMFWYYDCPITNPFNMSIINAYNWEQFMEYWCGFAPEVMPAEAYLDNPEVINMPHYPNDGSIQIIDGVVIVNF